MSVRPMFRHLILVSALCLAVLLDSPVAATAPAVMAAEPAPATAPRKGPQPFVTLFCQFPDVPTDERLRAYYQELLGDTAPGLADYWREVSYGQMSLDGSRVAGWYRMPRSSGEYRLRCADQAPLRTLAEDCTAAADNDIFFPDYAGINLVFNLCPDNAYGGRISLTRDGQAKIYGITWLCRNDNSRHQTVAHEMGHALGLHHAVDEAGGTYTDPWDVMSGSHFCRVQDPFGIVAQHPSAYRKDLLGWIPEDKKYVAQPGSTAHITLERLARPEKDDYLMAQVPLPDGGFYTLEARRRVGYDRNAPADGVVIHRVGPGNRPTVVLVEHESTASVLVDSVWAPGMEFVDDGHGIRVTVDLSNGTGYVVTISNGAAG